MKNSEKFKSSEERYVAFKKFCHKHDCGNCPVNEDGIMEAKCGFKWLNLEYEAELKPCPFCGGEAMERKSNGLYYVFCKNCSVKTVDSITPDAAIAAWNRRRDGFF